MIQDISLTKDPGTCSCAHDESDPVLDARSIPHAVRHAAIFGALDSLAPGAAMVLVAPHEPVPLLTQAKERYGDSFAVEYLQQGPDEWRLRFERAN